MDNRLMMTRKPSAMVVKAHGNVVENLFESRYAPLTKFGLASVKVAGEASDDFTAHPPSFSVASGLNDLNFTLEKSVLERQARLTQKTKEPMYLRIVQQ